MHDPHFWIRARELVGDLRGRVGAAVVDDDHLEVGGQLARGLQRGDDQARDRPAVVVGGKKHTEPRLRGRRRHAASDEPVNLSCAVDLKASARS